MEDIRPVFAELPERAAPPTADAHAEDRSELGEISNTISCCCVQSMLVLPGCALNQLHYLDDSGDVGTHGIPHGASLAEVPAR